MSIVEEKKMASESEQGCLKKVSGAINRALSGAFSKVGFRVGKNPWLTVILCVLVTLGLGSAFQDFKSESDPSKQFTPQGTRGLIDQADYESYFGNNVRIVNFIVKTKTGNILDTDNLVAVQQFYDEFRVLNGTADGVTKSYTDLCITSPAPCELAFISVQQAWGFDLSVLQGTSDPKSLLNSAFTEEQLNDLIGGLEFSGGLPDKGEVLVLQTFLKNTLNENFEDPVANSFEENILDLVFRGDSPWDSKIEILPFTTVSFGEEIGGSIGGDAIILSASYMIIIGYVLFVLQESCDRTKGSFALALLGVLTIGLSIISGFGLSQYMGFLFGNTHSILTFILLGIGADGVFILVTAMRGTDPKKSDAERAADALGHAGVSLTVSSLTNVAAFGIGSLTVIPDLSSFCKYAAISLFFLWVYLNTFFAAVLVLNERRVRGGKLDVLCCISDCRESVAPVQRKPSRLSNFMKKRYAPFITHPMVKYPVLLATLAWAAFCGYNITLLEVEATATNFLPDGSYLKENFELTSEYFGGRPTDVFIVTEEFDYFEKRDVYDALPSQFTQPGFDTDVPYIDPNSISFWFDAFKADMDTLGNGFPVPPISADINDFQDDPKLQNQKFPKNATLFYKYIVLWLASPVNVQRASNVKLNSASDQIERARISMQHFPIGAVEDGVFKEDAREIVKTVDKIYEIVDAQEIPTYVFSFKYTQDWASFKVIQDELIQNVGLALVAVAVVVTLLLGDVIMSLLVLMSVVLTMIMLLGVQPLLGLSIDTVAVVLFTLAVGISVDYTVHVGYEFLTVSGTRRDRVAVVLGDVGVPVIHGAVSTFLAVLLQSQSESYVFRVVFLDFFFAILFGAFNGLLILPMALSKQNSRIPFVRFFARAGFPENFSLQVDLRFDTSTHPHRFLVPNVIENGSKFGKIETWLRIYF